MVDESKPAIVLRECQHQDLDDIKNIARLSAGQLASRLLIDSDRNNPVAHILVASESDRIVGFLDYWYAHGEITVINIAVHPDHRRHKIAQRLIARMFEDQQDWQQAFLEVRASNEGAQLFYKSQGFFGIGLRKNYYSDGENAIVMEKRKDPLIQELLEEDEELS